MWQTRHPTLSFLMPLSTPQVLLFRCRRTTSLSCYRSTPNNLPSSLFLFLPLPLSLFTSISLLSLSLSSSMAIHDTPRKSDFSLLELLTRQPNRFLAPMNGFVELLRRQRATIAREGHHAPRRSTMISPYFGHLLGRSWCQLTRLSSPLKMIVSI